MKIYIEGLAAVGKTSFLHYLRSKNCYKIKVGDYAEFCHGYELVSSFEAQLLYLTKQEDADIYDRSPFGGLFYHLIYKYMDTIDQVEDDFIWKPMVCELTKMAENEQYMIIMIPQYNRSISVQRMQNRSNGIDFLDEQFVATQQEFFLRLLRAVPSLFRFITTETFEWYSDLENLIYSLFFKVPLIITNGVSNLIYDAGYDLSVDEDTSLRPVLGIQKVKCRERVFIPPGVSGIIHSRSSFDDGMIICGVVDATYIGPLSVRLVPFSDITLSAGMRIAQITFNKMAPRAKVVDKITNTCRGTKGFGSTGVI